MSEIDNSDSRLTPALASRLRSLTPARVGLGRSGASLETRNLLDFQRCHAQARDAVHSRLETAALAASLSEISGTEVLRLHSAAPDRVTYLQRPDLGRKLDEDSIKKVASHAPPSSSNTSRLALIIADGLSALAIERHASPLIKELIPQLGALQLAPLCIVEQARVAIGDEIGQALGAQISIVLIGERPGLGSSNSLGAYITWAPRPGRTDAERNCISNVRAEGLSYLQAAAQLGYYLTEARRRQLTGVALKEQSHALKEG